MQGYFVANKRAYDVANYAFNYLPMIMAKKVAQLTKNEKLESQLEMGLFIQDEIEKGMAEY